MVADLKIQGNKKIKTSFIKKLSVLKSGKALDSTVIENDIKRLKRLPSVSHAYYQVFPSEGNTHNVFYNIVENFTIIPSVNVYTTNDDEFAYRIGLYEFNMLVRTWCNALKKVICRNSLGEEGRRLLFICLFKKIKVQLFKIYLFAHNE